MKKEKVEEIWSKYDDAIKDRVVVLSDKPEGEGVAAYWRKGRKYNKEIRRYEDVSYWADLILNNPLPFKPKFYRER